MIPSSSTVKPVKTATQKDYKLVFRTNYHLLQVKSIAPSLSYHLPLRSLFCLFLSGCFFTGFIVANVYFTVCYQVVTLCHAYLTLFSHVRMFFYLPKLNQ